MKVYTDDELDALINGTDTQDTQVAPPSSTKLQEAETPPVEPQSTVLSQMGKTYTNKDLAPYQQEETTTEPAQAQPTRKPFQPYTDDELTAYLAEQEKAQAPPVVPEVAKKPEFSLGNVAEAGVELVKGLPSIPGAVAETLGRTYVGKDWKAEEQNKSDVQKWIEGRDKEAYVPTEEDKSKIVLPLPIESGGISMGNIKNFPKQAGYSLAGMATGVPAGIAAAGATALIPGGAAVAPKVGWAAGTLAAEQVMRRADQNQITQELFKAENEKSIAAGKGPLTDDAFNQIKEQRSAAITKHGFAESGFEIAGDLAQATAALLPTSKIPGLNRLIASKVISPLAARGIAMLGGLGMEQTTETFTQYFQSQAEAEMGLREKPASLGESFSEVLPDTLLLSSFFLGGGAAGKTVYQRGRLNFNAEAYKAYKGLENGDLLTSDVVKMSRNEKDETTKQMLAKAARVGQKVYTPDDLSLFTLGRVLELSGKEKPTNEETLELNFLNNTQDNNKIAKHYGILLKPGTEKPTIQPSIPKVAKPVEKPEILGAVDDILAELGPMTGDIGPAAQSFMDFENPAKQQEADYRRLKNDLALEEAQSKETAPFFVPQIDRGGPPPTVPPVAVPPPATGGTPGPLQTTEGMMQSLLPKPAEKVTPAPESILTQQEMKSVKTDPMLKSFIEEMNRIKRIEEAGKVEEAKGAYQKAMARMIDGLTKSGLDSVRKEDIMNVLGLQNNQKRVSESRKGGIRRDDGGIGATPIETTTQIPYTEDTGGTPNGNNTGRTTENAGTDSNVAPETGSSGESAAEEGWTEPTEKILLDLDSKVKSIPEAELTPEDVAIKTELTNLQSQFPAERRKKLLPPTVRGEQLHQTFFTIQRPDGTIIEGPAGSHEELALLHSVKEYTPLTRRAEDVTPTTPAAQQPAVIPEQTIDKKVDESAPKVDESAQKQPWEMTKNELSKFMNNPYEDMSDFHLTRKQIKERDTWNDKVIQYHKRAIKTALSEGKTISPEVLADYPDLIPDTGKKVEDQKAKNVAAIVPHPSGSGYAVELRMPGKSGKRYVSGGTGPAGGGSIGQWATAEEAKKKGTNHLKGFDIIDESATTAKPEQAPAAETTEQRQETVNYDKEALSKVPETARALVVDEINRAMPELNKAEREEEYNNRMGALQSVVKILIRDKGGVSDNDARSLKDKLLAPILNYNPKGKESIADLDMEDIFANAEKAAFGEKKEPEKVEVKAEEPKKGLTAATAKALLSLPMTERAYPSGPSNVPLRQRIVEELTGKKVPASKAGVTRTRDMLAEAAGIDIKGKSGATIEDEIRTWLAKVAGIEESGAKSPEELRAKLESRQKPPKSPTLAEAGQDVAAAVSKMLDASTDAINAVSKLFGSGSNKLSMGIGFDEDTYNKAKPDFQSAWDNVLQAFAHLKDATEKFKAIAGEFARQFLQRIGPDAAANAKPYLMRFMKDKQAEAVAEQKQVDGTPQAKSTVEPETNNINKRHTIDKDTVSTPAGAISAGSVDSIWHYQGDIAMLQMAKVRVGGEVSSEYTLRQLEQWQSAKKAGFKLVNVRSGKYGTLWVLERDGEYLTQAGAEALQGDIFDRPEMGEDGAGWDNFERRSVSLARKFTDWLKTLKESTLNSASALATKVNTTEISKWAKIDRDKNSVYLQYINENGKNGVRISVSGNLASPNMPDYIKGASNDVVALLHTVIAISQTGGIREGEVLAAKNYKSDKSLGEILSKNESSSDIVDIEKKKEKPPTTTLEPKSDEKPGEVKYASDTNTIKINQEHINALEPMQRGRLNAALEKKFNTPMGVMTLRQYLESGAYSHVESEEVPVIEYNRTKFNRMNYEEQAKYEKRLKEKKTEYRAISSKDASQFLAIPKIVYDAIVAETKQPTTTKEPWQMTDAEANARQSELRKQETDLVDRINKGEEGLDDELSQVGNEIMALDKERREWVKQKKETGDVIITATPKKKQTVENFKRTTPAKGTAERTALESDLEQNEKAYAEAVKQRDATKNSEKKNKLADKAWELQREHDRLRDRNYAAMIEDTIENPVDDAQLYGALTDLYNRNLDKEKAMVAYHKMEAAIHDEAIKQGATEEQAKEIVSDQAPLYFGYPVAQNNGISNVVKSKLERYAREEAKKQEDIATELEKVKAEQQEKQPEKEIEILKVAQTAEEYEAGKSKKKNSEDAEAENNRDYLQNVIKHEIEARLKETENPMPLEKVLEFKRTRNKNNYIMKWGNKTPKFITGDESNGLIEIQLLKKINEKGKVRFEKGALYVVPRDLGSLLGFYHAVNKKHETDLLPQKFTKESTKPTNARVLGEDFVEYYNPYRARKDKLDIDAENEFYHNGYYTDGYVIVKMEKTKGLKSMDEFGAAAMQSYLDEDTQPAEIVGEFFAKYDTKALAHVVGESGEVVINAEYADQILSMFPDATVHIGTHEMADGRNLVYFKDKKGNVLAAVAPRKDVGLTAENPVFGPTLKPRVNEVLSGKGLKETSLFSLSSNQTGGTTIIGLKEIREAFPRQNVKRLDNGNFEVTFQNGNTVFIAGVAKINVDTITMKVNYDKVTGKTAVGSARVTRDNQTGVIQLVKGKGDQYTLAHESYHILEFMGMITPFEQRHITKTIQDLTAQGKWEPLKKDDIGGVEDRARYMSDLLAEKFAPQGVLERAWTRINDFIARIAKLAGLESSRGIAGEIKSGRVFDRAGDTGINSFSVAQSFSLKEAVRKITDNPNFVKWFGDSKVVDANGEPLVVYHGTLKGSISEFLRKNSSSMFWFAKNSEYANTYAGEGDQDRSGKIIIKKTEAAVYPVYLSIKNPIDLRYIGNTENKLTIKEAVNLLFGITDVTDYFQSSREAKKELSKLEVYEKPYSEEQLKNAGLTHTTENTYKDKDGKVVFIEGEAPPSRWDKDLFNFFNDTNSHSENETIANKIQQRAIELHRKYIKYEQENNYLKTLINKYNTIYGEEKLPIYEILRHGRHFLEKNGYDGVIAKEQGETVYGAFSPTQIKSIYNTGSFDANNPDIRYQLSPKDKKDAILTNEGDQNNVERQNLARRQRKYENISRYFAADKGVFRTNLINQFKASGEIKPVRVLESYTPAQDSIIQRASRLGVDCFFFETEDAFINKYIHGFMDRNNYRDTIFINAKFPAEYVRTSKHELFHNAMAKDKTARKKLYDRLQPQALQYERYKENATLKSPEYFKALSEHRKFEEYVSDYFAMTKLERGRSGFFKDALLADTVMSEVLNSTVENPESNPMLFTGGIAQPAGENKGGDIAYHRGDLKYARDTVSGKMTRGRSTGHFGTGVYFLSKNEDSSSRSNRPIHTVDFSRYNLLKPKDNDAAKSLHDGLKIVNDMVSNYSQEYMDSQSDDKITSALHQAAFKIWITNPSVFESTKNVADIIKGIVPEVAKTRKFADPEYAESASTKVMKAFGYEGIDVRHLPDYDNTEFGSVIYEKEITPEQGEGKEAYSTETMSDYAKKNKTSNNLIKGEQNGTESISNGVEGSKVLLQNEGEEGRISSKTPAGRFKKLVADGQIQTKEPANQEQSRFIKETADRTINATLGDQNNGRIEANISWRNGTTQGVFRGFDSEQRNFESLFKERYGKEARFLGARQVETLSEKQRATASKASGTGIAVKFFESEDTIINRDFKGFIDNTTSEKEIWINAKEEASYDKILKHETVHLILKDKRNAKAELYQRLKPYSLKFEKHKNIIKNANPDYYNQLTEHELFEEYIADYVSYPLAQRRAASFFTDSLIAESIISDVLKKNTTGESQPAKNILRMSSGRGTLEEAQPAGENKGGDTEAYSTETMSDYAKKISWQAQGMDFSTEGLRDFFASIYSKLVMREYGAVRFAKAAGREAQGQIENLIRRIRGKGGIAEDALTGKGPSRLKEDGSIEYRGSKSLKDILSPLGKSKEAYVDFETMRVAMRDIALSVFRPDIVGTTQDESVAELARISGKYTDLETVDIGGIEVQVPRQFSVMSKEMREWEKQTTLDPLHEIGWLSDNAYEKITTAPEGEYYASFMREMEQAENYVVGSGGVPVKKLKGTERDLKKIPSVEAAIANLQRTIRMVEQTRLNKRIVDLKDVSDEYAEIIKEVKPNYIPVPLSLKAEQDPDLYKQLKEIARSLGVSTETMRSIGSTRMGQYEGEPWSQIDLMFGTTEKTYAHELGHALDEKLGLIEQMIAKGNQPIKQQLRLVADTRASEGSTDGYKKYCRKKEEQIAEFIARYFTRREWLGKVAPDAVMQFEDILQQNRLLDKVKDIGPSGKAGLTYLSDIVYAESFTPPDGTITVPKNGKRFYYSVPEEVKTALDAPYSANDTNIVMKLLSYPTRWLRKGATLSLDFIARNPVRDNFTAMIYSRYGFIPFWDMARGLAHLAKKSDLYAEYKASGAEQSYFTSLDRQATEQLTSRDVVGHDNKKWLRALNPLEALSMLSEVMEKGTRLGAYVNARGKGATALEAMAEAREITLDFGRIGEQGRAINQMIAFWNANVQGTDKMVRAFKMKPGKTAFMALAGITMPSLLLWLINHDDDRYKELPDWQKNFFWIIITGKDKDSPIIRIPKPFELGVIFGSLPERILDYIYNNDKDSIKGIRKAILGGFMPGMIPTAALPAIEYITNHSFFRDAPLEGMKESGLPAGQRYNAYTSELAKKVGKLTDVSPIMIENWVKGWTGTLGSQGLQLTDMMMGDVPKPAKPWYQSPLAMGVKAFTVKNPIGSGSKSVQQFYETLDKTTEASKGRKQLLLARKGQEAREFTAEHLTEIAFSNPAQRTSKQLSMLRASKNRILDSATMDSETKKIRIDMIDKKISSIAKGFMLNYNKAEDKKKAGGKSLLSRIGNGGFWNDEDEED